MINLILKIFSKRQTAKKVPHEKVPHEKVPHEKVPHEKMMLEEAAHAEEQSPTPAPAAATNECAPAPETAPAPGVRDVKHWGCDALQTPHSMFLTPHPQQDSHQQDSHQQDSHQQQPTAQTIRKRCRALFDWYEERAETAEREQQKRAEARAHPATLPAHWDALPGDALPGDDNPGKQQSRTTVPHRPKSPPKHPYRPMSLPKRPLPLRAGKRTQLGRARQHWDTPEGRLLVQVRLCETVLLPEMRAQNADARAEVNARLADGLGLADAVAAGMLAGYVVAWQATGRWPRRPVSVLLFWPGGRRQGALLRGKYGPLLADVGELARKHFGLHPDDPEHSPPEHSPPEHSPPEHSPPEHSPPEHSQMKYSQMDERSVPHELHTG